MTMTQLPDRAELQGGTATDIDLVDVTTISVEDATDRAPSFYRALAVLANAEIERSYRIAPVTVGLDGESSAAFIRLRVRTPVDTDEPIVQKALADDGAWRRKSTSEVAWSGWVPIESDLGLGTAASVDVGSGAGNVPEVSDGFFIELFRDDTDTLSAPGISMTHTMGGAPAAGDLCGTLSFRGEQTPSGTASYAQIKGYIVDPANATIKGRMVIETYRHDGGGFVPRVEVGAGLYMSGTTDNGFDTITGDQFYLEPDAAPSNPTSGWALYVDSGDGNKLKAKHSTGTVVTLGTP